MHQNVGHTPGNMIVTLIPFFLAANIAVNKVDWEYGPEVIWNVQVNAIAHSQDYKLHFATTNSTLKLRCRLESKLLLNCRFREIRYVLAVLQPDKSWSTKDSNDFGENGPGEDAFKLQFCPEGIQDIIVSSSIDRARLDMIRALVSQLNVGADLSEVNIRNFNGLENSSVGVCNTIYYKSTDKAADKDNVDNDENRYYEFVNMRGSIYPSFERGQLEKTRMLDDCLYRTNYVYGTRENGPNPTVTLHTTLTSSRSKMTMTKSEFTSYTANSAIISNKKRNGNEMIIEEKIILSLADIVPAMGPIPTIYNPSRASIFPMTGLSDDSSDESMDNESY